MRNARDRPRARLRHEGCRRSHRTLAAFRACVQRVEYARAQGRIARALAAARSTGFGYFSAISADGGGA